MYQSDIKFGLRKITTVQFATIGSVAVQEDSIRLNLNFGFSVDEQNRIVGCNAKFEFLSKEIPFIALEVQCDFEIDPTSWEAIMNKDLKTITLPVEFNTHLAFLTVGTARGILHSKTENTVFNKYFLPTLNISEILNKDIVMELQNQ